MSADGNVIWTLDLPPAANRLIESDESGVSISSFDLAGVERAEGMKSFIMGNTGDEPKSEHQTLAYATAAGKLAWSVDSVDEEKAPTEMSAPGTHDDQIAVSRGDNLYVYSRKDGHEVFHTTLSGGDAFNSQVLQASFNRPVFSDGNWYAAHLNHLVRSIPPARCRTTAAASASFPRS